MRLADIMETAVDTIGLDDSAEAAWERMRLGRIHHLVVMNEHAMAAVISERDLGGARGARLRDGRQVRDLMTANVVAAAPTTTVREAANLMRGRSIGCLPVVQKGSLRGIITVTDLLELHWAWGGATRRPVRCAAVVSGGNPSGTGDNHREATSHVPHRGTLPCSRVKSPVKPRIFIAKGGKECSSTLASPLPQEWHASA